MAYNGSGVFQRIYNWVNDANAAIPITASRMDTEDTGFATGLSNVICKDGQTTITADIPFNSKKITGLASGTGATHAVNLGQVQNSSPVWLGTSASTNTVTATATPTLTAYAAGQTFRFLAGGTCTGAVTLNIDALGAKAVQKLGAALIAGDITANNICEVVYDGTQFQLISIIPISGVTEAMQTLADNTTNNVSTSRHGYVPKAPNDVTKFLDGTGAFSVPAGGSEWVYITKVVPSASATADFITQLTSGYSAYAFVFNQVSPDTDQVNLLMRFSNSGSSWNTGANYKWASQGVRSDGTTTSNGDGSGGTSIQLGPGGTGWKVLSSSAYTLNGSLMIYNPADAISKKQIISNFAYYGAASTSIVNATGVGSDNTGGSAVTGAQFFFSAGNIASGTIYLFALKNT